MQRHPLRLPLRGRAFTLIELIVTILILGVLAAIAVVGYTSITNRATVTAAKANLANIAKAVMVHHTADEIGQLERAEVIVALDTLSVDVVDALDTTAAESWTLLGKDAAPTKQGEFAIGFATGVGTAANDVAGTRAVVITPAPGGAQARFIVYGSDSTQVRDGEGGTVPDGATPADVLADPSLVDSEEPFTPTPAPSAPTEPTTPAPSPTPTVPEVVAPTVPVISAVRNGTDLNVSWTSTGGERYEVRTAVVERFRPDINALTAAKLSDGSYVVASLDKVTRYAPDGTVVWKSGAYGYQDGPIADAKFQNIVAVAVDSRDNIFLAEQGRHTIRKITPEGVVTTFAGVDGTSGNVNGAGAAARLAAPRSIAIDAADNLFVAEQNNQAIRKITPAGVVSTTVGYAGLGYMSPGAIVKETSGNFLVSGTNGSIVRMTPAGVVTPFAQAPLDENGDRQALWHMAISSTGDAYVTLRAGIYKVSPTGVFTLVAPKETLSVGLPDAYANGLSFVDGELWVAVWGSGPAQTAIVSLAGAVRPFDVIDLSYERTWSFNETQDATTYAYTNAYPSSSQAVATKHTFTVVAINSAGRAEGTVVVETSR